jgi:hypothetical protein
VKFAAGDAVKVEYQHGKFYDGVVLWTETNSSFEWVTVRPNDLKYISTFGSARDMSNQYKSYIANDPILGKVFLK